MCAGSFNPTTGAYVFSIYPTAVVTYAAVLMLRHPFVPTSQQLAVFTLNSIQDPAVAAAQAAAAASAAAAAASAAVAPPPAPTGPVLNPLSMPRVAFTATFPAMTAAGYGGLTRALGDYRSILAAACGLDSTDWVVAAAAGQAPLALNTTVSCSNCPYLPADARSCSKAACALLQHAALGIVYMPQHVTVCIQGMLQLHPCPVAVTTLD